MGGGGEGVCRMDQNLPVVLKERGETVKDPGGGSAIDELTQGKDSKDALSTEGGKREDDSSARRTSGGRRIFQLPSGFGGMGWSEDGGRNRSVEIFAKGSEAIQRTSKKMDNCQSKEEIQLIEKKRRG